MNLNDLHIDNTWTLFLDRDGVINKKIDGDYVRNLKMFEWINGSKEAIVLLSKIFREIIVVTNQQGVGKNLMNLNDLKKIHSFMISEIETEGGRIDAVYFSPHLANENNPMRKPGVGMLLKAKEEFPAIDFKNQLWLEILFLIWKWPISSNCKKFGLEKIKTGILALRLIILTF